MIDRRLLWLTVFAIAMAHVEAALVVHLRSLYYPGDPLELFPLEILSGRDLGIELARETATVVMILAVAALATKSLARGFAAFLYVFGAWDLFYYAWLKAMIGWPVRWLEWDVLFLIPWPWLGPWIAPALIALLFVAAGGRCLLTPDPVPVTRWPLAAFVAGAVAGVAAFLLPALPLLAGGEAAFRGYLPGDFGWGLFAAGWLLMAAGLTTAPWTRRQVAGDTGS